MTSTSDLYKFRTAYLQAVAKSWTDSSYITDLTSASNAFNCLEEFGFISPWPCLKLKLKQNKRNTPQKPDPEQCLSWCSTNALGWTGPNDTLVVQLPKFPQGSAPLPNSAELISAYYRLFPTLFGPDILTAIVLGLLEKDDWQQDSYSTEAGGSVVTGGTNLDSAFLNFGGITLQVIALGWNDTTFLSSITTADDASSILSNYFGFNNPWNFKIRFKEDDHFTWNFSVSNWNIKSVFNEIHLNLPYAPEDQEIRAIALTEYNNTGPEYPFTCL